MAFPSADPAAAASPTPAGAFRIRSATPGDVPALAALIRELAEFEQLTHLLDLSEARLTQHLFGADRVGEAWMVDATGEPANASPGPVAFALCFRNFSTFLTRPGLYLEDLYVQPAWRGRGIGQAVLRHLAALAMERGCGRFEWSVLDWNENAIRFYEGMGATVLPDWRICRVTGEALQALAAGQIVATPKESA